MVRTTKMETARAATDVNAIAETRTLVTAIKLKQLYLKKQECESHFVEVLESVEKAATEKEKLKILVDVNAKRGHHYNWSIFDSNSNVADLFSMAENDPTVSDELFKPQRVHAEQSIRRLLRKTQYTSLFGSIFNEWMNFEGKFDVSDDDRDGVKTPRSDDESTTGISSDAAGRPEKLAQKAELESIIFDPDPKAKPEELVKYLENLFKQAEEDANKANTKKPLSLEILTDDDYTHDDEEDGHKQDDESSAVKEDENDQNYLSGFMGEVFTMKKLRNTIGRFSGSFRKHESMGITDVKQSIHGLISGELLTEAKKEACKEILLSDVILGEIAMVLNLRLREIENWKYADPSIQMNFRRHLNGKYRCYADEPLLDAIFLQWIGIRWGMELRRVLELLHNSTAWLQPEKPIDDARQEVRNLMLSRESLNSAAQTVQAHQKAYMKEFFLTLLPESLYDFRTYNEDGQGADEEKKDNEKIRRARNEELKQRLLQRVLIDKQYLEAVDPGKPFTVVQADAYRFAQSQSHEVILALMKFIGVTKHWLKFFESFLKLPARFEAGGPTKESKRGVPISHPLGLVFGEIQLFLMEFAVNRATGGTLALFRMHDDFWWWGSDEKQCELAWNTIKAYSELTGTEWNLDKSGCVHITSQPTESNTQISSTLPTGEISWGFIALGTDGVWRIKQDELEKHIAEMKLQMDSQKSILGIIGAYNRYMKFFVRNFGKPARAFGKQHVEQIITAVTKIHNSLFPSHDGNVLSYIGSLVTTRFGDEISGPIPQAWLLMPVANGGLGVRNVLFDILPILKAYIQEDEAYERQKRAGTFYRPTNFKQCIKKDRIEYEIARDNWLKPSRTSKVSWDHDIPDEWFDGMEEWLQSLSRSSGNRRRRQKQHPFITFEEFILGRQGKFTYWGDVWKELAETPIHSQRYAFAERIQRALSSATYSPVEWLRRDYATNTPYWRSWLLGFGEQALDAFGDFRITEETRLPVAMIDIYMNLKTKWDQ
ncbi:hypothetical protein Dda_0013 [Drechslerella dactyloides]|uniref:Reverse transcriptase n=1 Tax=Drechslerella dactyloides TaxID=74499 RepID=A0AAD6NLI8_DREDA|nr:hypothetical protein Dda_0013 [Drechslerella dactyloides]